MSVAAGRKRTLATMSSASSAQAMSAHAVTKDTVLRFSCRTPNTKEPFARLDLLGRHSFEVLAHMMFKAHFSDALQEELFMHVWNFHVDMADGSTSVIRDSEGMYGSLMDDLEGDCDGPKLTKGSKFMQRDLDCFKGMTMIFTYDLGDPTTAFIVVESIKPAPPGYDPKSYPRQYIDPAITAAANAIDCEPRAGTKVDDVFPQFSKTALDRQWKCVILGAMSKTCATVVQGGDLNHENDQLICPLRFRNPEDMFVSCEAAWLERAAAVEESGREGWMQVMTFPPEDLGEDDEDVIHEAEYACDAGTARYGPKQMFSRMSAERHDVVIAALRAKEFEFKKRFPKTFAFLSPKRGRTYRWVKFCRGTVTIIKGTSATDSQPWICSRLPGPSSTILGEVTKQFSCMDSLLTWIETTLP